MRRRRMGLPPSPSQQRALASPSESPSVSSSSPASAPAAPTSSPHSALRSPLRRGTALQSTSKGKVQDPELAALQIRRVELKGAIRESNERVRRMQLIEKCLDVDEMNKLMDLCSKWQHVAQVAAEELRAKSAGMVTLKQVLEAFAINPDSLNYHAASDAFGGTTW